MAPTQQQNTESSRIHNTSSTSSVNTTSSTKAHTTSNTATSYVNSSNSNSMLHNRATVENQLTEMESLLPITTRGLFQDDSFFEDARKHFHEAVKEVLDRWKLKSGHVEDNLASYKNLRESDLREDNRAVSVSHNDTCHKVVLDIRDFMKGDVKVKMVDENELVVEGNVEKQENGSVSKKSFRRSFVFPGLIKSQHVSSAMSSDGILTVTVPKNNQSKVSNIQVNCDTKTSNNAQSMLTKHTISENTDLKSIVNSVESNFLLPVTKKGLFFHDSFFESARQDFEKAVQDILNKHGKKETFLDTMTNYRSLRERNLKDENQAISVTEHKEHHKVVLDVKDFMNGDLKVKMVDENELKIEGSAEFQKDGTTSRKSFCRSFTFPGLIKSDAVTSAMSSDGILTVTVPKTITNKTLGNKKLSTAICSQVNEEAKVSRSNTTTEKTSENATSEESKNSQALETSFDSLLPVFHKGLFFQDDFFESARKDYENAVQEVLGKSGITASITDNMSSYRTLRDTDLRDENQAVSVTEDHQCHKVVMDVRDFMYNDLKVKVVDENKLVVEGTSEKKEGESVSKKSFRRSFVFPGLVKSNSVSSALSSDGVLTITIPKASQPGTSVKTVTLSRNDGISTSEMSKKNYSTQRNQKSSLSSSQVNTADKSRTLKSELDSFSAFNVLNNFDKENMLPNTENDTFFKEDFITSARQDFENIVKEISDECRNSDFSCNAVDNHRSLQECNAEEGFAVSLTEDNDAYKIVVHVGDFAKDSIQVKLLNDCEVLIEGHIVKQEAGKSSTKSFSRRFQLPSVVLGVSSTLSKDRILTITAQKDSKNSISNSRKETTVLSHCDNNKSSFSNSHQQHAQQIQKTSSSTSSISTHSTFSPF